MLKPTTAQEFFGVSEERLLICLIKWAKTYHYVDPYVIEQALDIYESEGAIPRGYYDILEMFILKYDIDIN